MRTFDQIKAAALKMKWQWDERPFHINMCWERTNDEFTNRFTDFLYLCYKDDKGNGIVEYIPATTKAGLKGSVLEPVTVHGVTGTAVIQFPQQGISSWKFRDTYEEFSHYPYFRQIAPVNYWRDGDKDTHIDRVQGEHEINETHGHRMSQNGTYGSGQINNWSLGCMGAPEPEWIKILSTVRRHVKLYGDLFTWLMFETKDLN